MGSLSRLGRAFVIFLCPVSMPLALSSMARADMTIDCEFTETHVTLLEGGKAVEEPPKGGFKMTFTGFDDATGKVKVVGSLGAADALFSSNKTRLIIIETTDAENIMVTSIEAPSRERASYAVHTRHTWIGPGALISTMVGPCSLR